MSRTHNAIFISYFIIVIALFHTAAAERQKVISLSPGVYIQNIDEPFDYFINSWTVIGLKDYVNGTRITPNGELILSSGLICRPLIEKPMTPLNWRVKKTLLKGYLPVVRFDFIVNKTIRYTIETFACPLDSKQKANYNWPTENNFLNLIRVTFTNLKKTPTEAYFGLEWRAKKGELKCEIKETPPKNEPSVFSNDTLLCTLQLQEEGHVVAKGPRVVTKASLAGNASARVVALIPFRPIARPSADILRTLSQSDFDTRTKQTISFWEGLLNQGTRVEVPEEKPMNTYKASLVYQFIGRDKAEVHAGEGFYDGIYLRDGSYQAISLAHAGYLDAARESIEHFLRFQDKDGFFCTQRGQLDGHGYAVWVLVEYYRLSGDTEWLQRVYPQIKRAVSWIQRARRKEKDSASPFFGVLPAAPADGENLWDGKHHIVGYDWWSLRGIQSAVEAARVLGKAQDAAAFAKEFEDYRRCILQAIEKTGLPYIPPSYEKDGTHWGNLEVIFPTLLIDPHAALLTATLEYVRNEFGAVDGEGGGFLEGIIQWSPPQRGAIHPYMSQFVTNSHIIRGDYDEAIDGFYSFLLHTTSTHGFPEGVYYKRRQAWGDTVPHLWAAALYVTTLRNMLVREQGNTLHLLSCVPVHWLDDGKRIRIEGAPTHFGKVGFTAAAESDVIRVQLNPPDRNAVRRIVVHLPKGIEIQTAKIQGRPVQVDKRRAVILDGELARKPCTVTIRIKRLAQGAQMTFESKVAAYQEEAAYIFKPIPNLVPLSEIGEINERDCVKLDLSPFANTNPLTAPFNVSNPGRYLFTGLPLGDQRISGVPFHIIEPAKNEGRGLVVLNGANACAAFPRGIEVPVGVKGRFLCVLGNVTGWLPTDPGVGKWGAVGEYEIRYADGTSQKVPLITGRTVDDWAQMPNATDVVVGLKEGIWHLNLLAVALEPKTVTSIVIRDLGTPASPVVAAMTIIR